MRSKNFGQAASVLRDALPLTNNNEMEKCVVTYCQAMALLESASLDNVKEGQTALKELYQSNLVDWIREFPAVHYGLAKYEFAVNEKLPVFIMIEHQTYNIQDWPYG
jgi:hypothetical protein